MITALAIRQKTLQYAEKLHQHKGTIKPYQLIFAWLGFYDILFVEIFELAEGFDSVGFDDSARTFDGKCSKCARQNIFLKHDQLNEDLKNSVRSIIKWNSPLNVETYVYYNNDTMGIFDKTFDKTFN